MVWCICMGQSICKKIGELFEKHNVKANPRKIGLCSFFDETVSPADILSLLSLSPSPSLAQPLPPSRPFFLSLPFSLPLSLPPSLSLSLSLSLSPSLPPSLPLSPGKRL
jgi:hypothetical protein